MTALVPFQETPQYWRHALSLWMIGKAGATPSIPKIRRTEVAILRNLRRRLDDQREDLEWLRMDIAETQTLIAEAEKNLARWLPKR